MPDKEKTVDYYRSLSLRNFRGFKRVDDIPLAPLTFFVGPNSSGKSSLLDAFLLVTQSHWLPGYEHSSTPRWIGPLVDLGSYGDVVFGHNTNLPIKISLEVSFSHRRRPYLSAAMINRAIKYTFALKSNKEDPIGRISQISLEDSLSEETVQIRLSKKTGIVSKLQYRNLEYSPRSDFDRDLPPYYRYDIGYGFTASAMRGLIDRQASSVRGRKAALNRIITHISNDFVYNRLTEETQKVSSGRAAPRRWYPRVGLPQVDRPWLRKVNQVFDAVDPLLLGDEPDAKIRLQNINNALKKLDIGEDMTRDALSPYHWQVYIRDNITKIISKIIDVGYGASQIIPVLTACADSRNGPLFIEQPEIHLHPKAQGIIGELLGKTSLHRQVVVETHSVHLINRVRLMIARGELHHGRVIINYVYRNKSGGRVRP